MSRWLLTKKRKLVLIYAVALAFIVALIVMSASPKSQQPIWLSKGAYAEYSGKTQYRSYGLSIPVDVNLRLEVLDFNSTHIKTLEDWKFETVEKYDSFFENYANSTIKWYKKLPDRYPTTLESRATLVSTKDAGDIYVSGKAFATRAYEYNEHIGDTTVVYVSKDMLYPLKIAYHFIPSLPFSDFNMSLVRTNIPGLLQR